MLHIYCSLSLLIIKKKGLFVISNRMQCSALHQIRAIWGTHFLKTTVFWDGTDCVGRRPLWNSVNIDQTTRWNIPEDSNLHNRRREDLKCHMNYSLFNIHTRRSLIRPYYLGQVFFQNFLHEAIVRNAGRNDYLPHYIPNPLQKPRSLKSDSVVTMMEVHNKT